MGFLSAYSPWATLDADYNRRRRSRLAAQPAAAGASPGLAAPTPPPAPPSLPPLVGPPNGQPQMGPEWMSAPTAPKPGDYVDPSGPKQQPGPWARLSQGLQNGSLFENPMLQVGLSLLGRARDGGDWAGVGQDMQQMNRERMLRQRLQNEERRQKASDAREETVFGRQQTEWGRADEQRAALDAWISTLPPEQQRAARANPAAAHAAFMEAQAAANAPITPFQQAQLDIQRRGLDIEASRVNQQDEWIPRGADLVTMRNLQAGAEQAFEARYLLDSFEAANRRTGTGYGSEWLPWNGFSSDRAAMRQASSLIQTMTAPQGQGAVSNMERDLFRQAAPSVDLGGNQNSARIAAARDIMDFRIARQAFYSEYGRRNRSLNGAETEFQRSPEFRAIAERVRRRQQGESAQAQSGEPPLRGQINDPMGIR